MTINEIQQMKIADFCQQNKVCLMVIFGSHAKGSTHSRSDIDIALALEENNAWVDKLQLIFELEGIFDRSVDLVVLRTSTDPLLQYEIFSSGKLIYEREPFLFNEYKLRAWRMYLDTQKLRDLRNEFVKNYIRKLADDNRSVQ